MGAASSKQLEDLYLPHRPKRSTRSTAAQDKGLAPLAQLLLAHDTGLPPHVLAKSFVSKDVKSPVEALAGARDILAEQVRTRAASPSQTQRSCRLSLRSLHDNLTDCSISFACACCPPPPPPPPCPGL